VEPGTHEGNAARARQEASQPQARLSLYREMLAHFRLQSYGTKIYRLLEMLEACANC